MFDTRWAVQNSGQFHQVNFLRLLFVLLHSFIAPGINAAEPQNDIQINEISISGNITTQTEFIVKWSALAVEDSITSQKLEEARQNILDTGLFKQVTVRTEVTNHQAKVFIAVEEKHFSLVYPRLSRNADGDIKSGLRLRLHNLQGANRSFDLLVVEEDKSSGDNSRIYRMSYKLPQLSKPYLYQWNISQSISNTENDGFNNVEYSDEASFSISRNWFLGSLSYPLLVTSAIDYQHIRLQKPYPSNLNEIDDGNYNRLSLRLEYDGLHEETYRRYGRYYSVRYTRGFEVLHSDYESQAIEIESRIYHRLNDLDNFNSRMFLGVSRNSPFNQLYYAIGSAATIRGLDQETDRGDVIFINNLEYVIGYNRYRSFRSSIFVDIGNVYKNADSIDLTDLKVSVGAGLRWKAVSFVNTDLFIDVAYDLDSKENKVYGGTSLNF